MSDPFVAYAKKALSPAPARLIGVTKTRAEAKAGYVTITSALRACQTLSELRQVLADRRLEILQIQAEMEFLWFGDGHDFPGLEREIETAFETVEAATFFRNENSSLQAAETPQPATPNLGFPAKLESEAGRLPGHLKQDVKS